MSEVKIRRTSNGFVITSALAGDEYVVEDRSDGFDLVVCEEDGDRWQVTVERLARRAAGK